jgi:hypothetical protein
MPANLTPQYLEAEKRFRRAKTVEEKVRCLEEMLAVIPKHKGTDHLQGDLKRRLSKLRETASQKSATGKRTHPRVEREGAGQAVILGPPNSGKSTLLSLLTNATPEIGHYPFTTHGLNPGMMVFENVQIQLVDTPPVHRDCMEHWLPEVIRTGDLVLLLLDLSAPDLLETLELIIDRLAKHRIYLYGKVEISHDEDPFGIYMKTLVLGNKADKDADGTLHGMLAEVVAGRFEILTISCRQMDSLKPLPKKIFDSLEILRIFSKMPGKKPDLNEPFVVAHGTTVLEMAAQIHKDFEAQFKFARLWGSGKYDGQKVNRDHVLQDGDIVEIHLQ